MHPVSFCLQFCLVNDQYQIIGYGFEGKVWNAGCIADGRAYLAVNAVCVIAKIIKTGNFRGNVFI